MPRLWLYLIAGVLVCGLVIGHPATPVWLKVAVEGTWLLVLATIAAWQLWRTLRGQVHLLRARLGVPTSRAPTHYVRRLFDEYASYYDRHLLEELGYAVPNLLRSLVGERLGGKKAKIADLGCGTGVLAPLFRHLAAELVGVDLSRRMLQRAAERDLYDELVEAEVIGFLRARASEFDLLLAADLLVYLGDLDDFVGAAAGALRPRGLLAMSTEHADNGAFAFLSSGRFAHDPAYVRRLAERHGLILVEQCQGKIRTEGGAPIIGDLYLLQRP